MPVLAWISVATRRMNREQFFGKLAVMDEAALQKAMWTLYWRGTAAMRERIEAEVDPAEQELRERRSKELVDPELLLAEVSEFVELVRSGAYMGGDRRVSPRERTRWRVTFRRLVTQAQDGLVGDDVGTGAAAVEQLVDLACTLKDYDYVRSEDPVEAARVVVSDAVALLWTRLREEYGFSGFASRAAPQLVRWEAEYGWTRQGYGRVSEKETSLASVLTGMLRVPDQWVEFADQYLDALDLVARDRAGRPARSPWGGDRDRERRTGDLAEWHLMLIGRLAGTEYDDRLDRLTEHPALRGPELSYLQARLAHERGDAERARSLAHEALRSLPGHRELLGFATEIGATLPPRAQEIANDQRIANQMVH